MMSSLRHLLFDSRVLSALGVAAAVIFVMLGAHSLKVAMGWAVALCALIVVVWGAVWAVRRHRARQAGEVQAVMASLVMLIAGAVMQNAVEGIVVIDGKRRVIVPEFAALVLESGDDSDGGPLS